MSSLVPRVTCPPAPSASRYLPSTPRAPAAAGTRRVVAGAWPTRGPGGGLVVVGSRPAPVSRLVADSWWSRVGSWWWALRLVVTAGWRARGRLVTGVVGSWWRARSRLQSRVFCQLSEPGLLGWTRRRDRLESRVLICARAAGLESQSAGPSRAFYRLSISHLQSVN